MTTPRSETPSPVESNRRRRPGAAPGTSALLLALTLAAPVAAVGDGHDHGCGGTRPITTRSLEAQRLFDRGLDLAWGFNHGEAARAFRQAADEDPECAMCWWGVALVLGPNINAPLDPRHYPQILRALARARQATAAATERERAYVHALESRYGPRPLADRRGLDLAYARAMRRVARAYPDDLDAQTLLASALMDTTPWNYWTAEGTPRPATREVLDLLESVLRRDPGHCGANHLLIHAVEEARPDLGVAAAERLARDPQATGHLIHMASHIYLRVGRYADAAQVNARAIAQDRAYAGQHGVPSSYVPYMLHNHHMRWAALVLAGDGDEALKEATSLGRRIDAEALRHPTLGAYLQHYSALRLFDHLRFLRWERVLDEARPAPDLFYLRALWHFARGVALVRTARLEAAEAELGELRALAVHPRLALLALGPNPAAHLATIATNALSGELAGARSDFDDAVHYLRRAVHAEDALAYDDPPPWLPPSRQRLGELLLEAQRPAAAAEVFRQDLKIYPRNPRSLRGLALSLEELAQDAPRPWTELSHGRGGLP